jgi:hypothetical protein
MFGWLGGEGFAASLARMAIGFGVMSYLRGQNESPASASSTPQGTRQQIQPATENKIPVAYGSSYFSGTIVDVQLVNDSKEMYAVIVLCETTGDIFSSNPSTPGSRTASSITIDDIYLSNQKITWMANGTTIDYTTDDTGVVDNNPHALVGVYLYNGNSNSPMLPCVSGTTTPISGTLPGAAYTIMPGWTSSSLVQNTVFAVVKMNYDPSKGLHTIPQLKFHVKNTITRPEDVLHDYMTNQMYGAGIPESLIDNASLVALGTYANENVTLGAYPAQPRYRINGVVSTANNNLDNIEKLAASAGAYFSYDITTGKWAVIANKATATTLAFNDSNVIGSIAVSGSALDSYYNKVEVQFPYAVLKDQSNFVRFDLPEIYQNANEPKNTLQLNHEFVNNVVQATVLANLDLRQSREDLVITLTTDYSKYNVAIGDVVSVTNSVYGWTAKLFKVIRVRKTESDAGELTVELTCQSYNADVYTVEDITDFVPLIGVGHSIPSTSPIATPVAPTVSAATISSQPSFTIHGVVPVGIVTEMEFWYTKDTTTPDSARNYTMLGTMRAENSGAFTVGDTPSFKTVLLTSGTYYFKVRAANATGSSAFSLPSTAQPYTYVQTPDALPYQVPVVDATGAAVGGMSLGLMAGYLATKLNWFGPGGIFGSGTATLASVFGLSSGAAADVVAAASSIDPATQLAVSNAITASQNAVTQANAATQAAAAATDQANAVAASLNTITLPAVQAGAFVVGQEYEITEIGTTDFTTVGAASNTVGTRFTATGPGTGTGMATPKGLPPRKKAVVFPSNIMPNLFGDGLIPNSSTRAGIWTHDGLAFTDSSTPPDLFPLRKVKAGSFLEVTLDGSIQNFYNIPDIATFSQKPFYDETGTDKFAVDTKITLYYSTCTYTSGNLDQQSWSPWTKISSNDGVTGTIHPVVTMSNPPDPEPAIEPYVSESGKPTNSAGVINTTLDTSNQNRNPFDENLPIITTIIVDERVKDLSLSTSGIQLFEGGTKIIIFGASAFNLPDGTVFANNTLFAHKTLHNYKIYPETIRLRQVSASPTRFVGIDANSFWVYWSDDGLTWVKLVKPATLVTTDPDWVNPAPPFTFAVFDGTKFFNYGYGDMVASSVNGKDWSKHHTTSGLHTSISHLIIDSGHYLAVGGSGVQTSSDGITWTALTMPSGMLTGPTSGVWDGSQYVVGGAWTNAGGNVLWTSPDGITFTPVDGLNNPSNQTFVSNGNTNLLNAQLLAEQNAAIAATNYRNASLEAVLP